MIDDFVWPSDQDRAENDELDRVCEALEVALERIDVQNGKLDSANQQGILDSSGSELKPCPFCGTKAEIKGGLEAQENYSVWCESLHHMDGGYDRDKLVAQWNQRVGDSAHAVTRDDLVQCLLATRGQSEGVTADAILSMIPKSGRQLAITPAMIEAGAKRLVRWEDDSTWPDSWRNIDVAAAKQDAERVIRSALSAAEHIAEHIAEPRKMVQGNVQAMGDLHFNEDDDYKSAVVIEFESREDFKAAMQAGQCKFSILGGDA